MPILPAPERSPYQCTLCGVPTVGLSKRYDGMGVCRDCIDDSIAEAESWHLTARLHLFMGCPSRSCEVCEFIHHG